MSTKSNTEKTTADKNKKAQDNKALFGPLGKYAIIAVIMVSIIVTSAIMLDRDMNTIHKEIAAIETEVAETNKQEGLIDGADVIAATEVAATTDTAQQASEPVKPAIEEAPVATLVAEIAEPVPATTVPAATAPASIAPVAATPVTAPAKLTAASETPAVVNEPAAPVQTAEVELSAEPVQGAVQQASDADREAEWAARIESYKLEQKQRMAEVFTRIETLEAQQLEQYKASQDEKIAQLREHITQQNTLIDALVERNEKNLEMRKATIQRHQSNREQMLNRI